jgi:formylglycine-generating enzyme required for sulfatase activity
MSRLRLSVLLFGTACLSLFAYAQNPLPANAGLPGMDTVNVPGSSAVKKLAITNRDFKLFKPDFTFAPGMDEYAVTMTMPEAEAYARWSGQALGSQLIWRPIPNSDKGMLYLAAEGLDMQSPGAEVTPEDIPAGMVFVPAGGFVMGTDNADLDEAPKHQDMTNPYFIDKYEVSNEEFKQQFPEYAFPAGEEKHPAVVTWEQAAAYAQKLGKRLPTEPEWEKAARGTDGRTFPWGEPFDPSFVAPDAKSPRGSAPACPESPFGCYDMAGSVWEWTADWYKPYPHNTAPSDAYGEKFRVIRGGAANGDIATLRCSQRYYLPQNTTGNLRVGFRCAMDVPKK